MLLIPQITGADVGGHVAVEYDVMTGKGLGEVQIHKDFEALRLGTLLRTDITHFTLKGNIFPAGSPNYQYFDMFVRYRTNYSLSVYLRSWCIHYFGQTKDWWRRDESGLNLGFKYEF